MKFSQVSEFLQKISYKRLRYLLLAVSGVLTGLTLVFPAIGFLEWLTLIPMGTVLLVRASDRSQKYGALYRDGFVFFYSYYLVCYHWFAYLYPLEFIDGMTKPRAMIVVIVAWFGLALLQALMGGVVFVFAALLFRCELCSKLAYLRVFIAAALWALFEWSQTIGWWGVPWGRLPIGQSHYLVGMQTASLFSSYFITFLLLAVNLSIAFALLYLPKWKPALVTAAALLVFNYGAGTLLWFTTDPDAGEAVTVACLQGNISSSDKWSTDSDIKSTEVYFRLISDAANNGAELVLLPETAFPYDIGDDDNSYLAASFSEAAEEYGIYIVVGAYTSDEDGNSLNSLICYMPNGEKNDTVYSKRHLVPFGEYVPMRFLIETFIPPLAELVMSAGEISPGNEANVIDADGVMLGGLICFDSIYEQLAYDSVRHGAQIICLSTNDSWFSDSAALYMHNAQAQMRAIENGRYVVRSANTGISTIINPRGEILSSLDPLVEGNVCGTVYARSDKTLYTVTGNLFIGAAFAFMASVVVINIVNKMKIRQKKVTLS